jgi:hypothetical protein
VGSVAIIFFIFFFVWFAPVSHNMSQFLIIIYSPEHYLSGLRTFRKKNSMPADLTPDLSGLRTFRKKKQYAS